MSHTLFMFKPASQSHENVRANHERHCAHRLKIFAKNVEIVTFLFNHSQILVSSRFRCESTAFDSENKNMAYNKNLHLCKSPEPILKSSTFRKAVSEF